MMLRWNWVPLLGALFISPSTQAVELEGIQLPKRVSVGTSPQTLNLNGAGVHKVFFVPIYIGALYTAVPIDRAETALTANHPCTLALHFLRDNISAERIRKIWRKEIEKQMPREAYRRLAPQLAQLENALPAVNEGDVLMVKYHPDEGAELWFNGERQIKMHSPELFKASMRIWLGQSPTDRGLKEALLSGWGTPGTVATAVP